MQAMRDYSWGQGKVEEVTGLNRDQRESQACQRRLAQMEKNRQKQQKRKPNALEVKSKAENSIING